MKIAAVTCYAFITIAITGILSCGKNEEKPDATALTGTWELTKFYTNGFIYTSENYAKGNGNTVTFGANGTFIKKVKISSGSSTNEYTYHLENGKFCTHEEPVDTFLYYGNEEPEILRLQNGVLYLESTTCADGGGSASGNAYRKINDH